jgi:hypothetical protein
MPTPPWFSPDFDRLMADARASRRPVTIAEARLCLGVFFEEHLLDQETLIIPRSGQIALTATSWVRVLQRAKVAAGRRP